MSNTTVLSSEPVTFAFVPRVIMPLSVVSTFPFTLTTILSRDVSNTFSKLSNKTYLVNVDTSAGTFALMW